MPWILDIRSTQRSPLHPVQMHGGSNRDTHLYLPHNNSSVYLTTTTYVRLIGRITNRMRSGWTTLNVSALSSPTPAPTHPEWPSQEQPGCGLTVSSTGAGHFRSCLCRWVMSSSAACECDAEEQTVDHVVLQFPILDRFMDCTAWRFWMIRQSNGCSTAAPISSAAKQWLWRTRSKDEELFERIDQHWYFCIHSDTKACFLSKPIRSLGSTLVTPVIHNWNFSGQHTCYAMDDFVEVLIESTLSSFRLKLKVSFTVSEVLWNFKSGKVGSTNH